MFSYVRAWALGCFHSLISAEIFRRAVTASVDSYAEIKRGVIKFGRVWRKVPEVMLEFVPGRHQTRLSSLSPGRRFAPSGSFQGFGRACNL